MRLVAEERESVFNLHPSSLPPSSLLLDAFACGLFRLLLRATLPPLLAQTVAALDAFVYPFQFFINEAAHAAQETFLEFGKTMRYVLWQNCIRRIAQIAQSILDRINSAVRRFIRLRHDIQPPLDEILVYINTMKAVVSSQWSVKGKSAPLPFVYFFTDY
jgi:hypothetical protein